MNSPYFKNIIWDYCNLTEVFQSRIKKFILRFCPEGKRISFTDSCFGHFIDDIAFTHVRSIGRDLIFSYDRHIDGDTDTFQLELKGFDLSGLYAIAMAFEEGSFKLIDEI